MGLGGVIVLVLLATVIGYILFTEKPFAKKNPSSDNLFANMPKIQVTLAKAPQDMTERLTPKWQAEMSQKLQAEGYQLMGDYSYAAMLFFWARTFLSPDKKSALLLVNWVEGKE